jgi:formylglycine-generating enzyme required for sulfatase activity
MPRVKALLDCVGLALCEKARKALSGHARFGDALPDVVKAAHDHLHKEFTTPDLRAAIHDLVTLDPPAYCERVKKAVDGLARVQAVPFKAELADYLSHLPAFARRFLMRPSDPTGTTVPEAVKFFKPEELLPFLPPHRPKLQVGHEPAGLDNWKLKEMLGVGETAETWIAQDATNPDRRTAIKFAVDPESQVAIREHHELFTDVFKLTDEPGVAPLLEVYLGTDPPALESVFVAGYDLTSLIWDWRWKYDAAKPEAALKLIRRLCDIVARAHAHGVIHRDLKPSNVRLHPTDGGKFTMWVTDFGWGQISSARSLQLSKHGTARGEQQWLAYRGAHTPLYASPQQVKKEPPDPRDDVYALGVIWYQLLRRDPHCEPPVGGEWVEEMRPHGVTDSQAKLLSACLSTRPEKRPRNTRELAEMLANVSVAEKAPAQNTDGSRIISLKDYQAPLQAAKAAAKAATPVVGAKGLPGFGGLPRTVVNAVGMAFVAIPPGRFQMGSPDTEPGRREHEGPQHPVVISRPFYMGLCPVTQGQFERVMGKNPSAFSRGHGGSPEHPVEMVSWHDAAAFCEALGRLPGEQMHGRAYRLPTEAEWEYCCRAGTTGPFSVGDKLTPADCHFASAAGKTGHTRTEAVGKHRANGFGLLDMHGNVQEWVNDWYDEYYYFDSPADDPPGPARGTLKVVRGGCFTAFANDCRSAARRGHAPTSPSNTTGFRVVLMVNG